MAAVPTPSAAPAPTPPVPTATPPPSSPPTASIAPSPQPIPATRPKPTPATATSASALRSVTASQFAEEMSAAVKFARSRQEVELVDAFQALWCRLSTRMCADTPPLFTSPLYDTSIQLQKKTKGTVA